jgi:hypothetical protein
MTNSDDESGGETASVKSSATTKSQKEYALVPDRYMRSPDTFKVFKGYGCKLISKDTDRFYILQLLQKKNNYYIFSRWGKEDKPGTYKTSTAIDDLNKAIGIFEKRFRVHTGVDWENRHIDEFIGNYTIYNDKPSMVESDDDPITKAKQILKDISFEINQNDSADENLIKNGSNEFFNLFPSLFKKQINLNSNDSIKKAKEKLEEYMESQEIEEIEE